MGTACLDVLGAYIISRVIFADAIYVSTWHAQWLEIGSWLVQKTHQAKICCLFPYILRGQNSVQSLLNAKLSPHRLTSRQIQMITYNLYVSLKLASLWCGLRLILVWWLGSNLILSKGKLTWNSRIACGGSFELSWWAHLQGSAKTHADWVWHSL